MARKIGIRRRDGDTMQNRRVDLVIGPPLVKFDIIARKSPCILADMVFSKSNLDCMAFVETVGPFPNRIKAVSCSCYLSKMFKY